MAETKKKPKAPRRKPRLTDPEGLRQAAECLRVLAHPQRLRMLQLLRREDHTVGELAEACGLASPAASEHLRLMERCGFLTAERQGRRCYYRVCEPHVLSLLDCVEARFGGG